MILTITLNPSVDINYKLEHFNLDNVNRVKSVGKTAGGKGLNVAHVLRQLGEKTAASGFLGGSLGGFIRKEINRKGIEDFFVEIEGDTRNCIAIIHEGQQTEILESGPTINEKESMDFLNKYSKDIEQATYITISGSTPEGINDKYYSQLIEIAHKNQKPVLLDTKGSLLKTTLLCNYKPFLIKPNQEELGDLVGKTLGSEKEIVLALQEKDFQGVEWVVVTLGGNGAIVKHLEKLYRVRIPKVDVVNPVGSGDSVIAGFAAGLSRGLGEEELIKFGLTMGTLNAIEEETGSIDVNKINWCMDAIKVEQIVQEYIKS